MRDRMRRAQSSKWLAIIATVLSVLWCAHTVDGYRVGVLPINEDGSVKFFDELCILDNFGSTLLIAEEAKGLNAIERQIFGASELSKLRKDSIRVLEHAHKQGKLTEEGVSMLSCLYWASGNKEDASKLVSELTDCQLSRSQTLIDLLAGVDLEAYQWEALELDMQDLPRDWTSCFLAEKACQSKLAIIPNKSKLERLVGFRKREMFTSNACLSLLSWMLFLAGIVFIIILWRSRSSLASAVAKIERPCYTSLWPLPLVLIGFVIGEFCADGLISFLWARTPVDLSGLTLLACQLGYSSVFQVFGSVVLVCVFFRPTRWASIKKTLFQPVPRLWCWVLATYSVVCVFGLILYSLPSNWFPVDPTLGYKWQEYGISGLILGLISGVLFAPIFEEIVFRGFLFNGLRNKLGPHFAAIISAVIFSSVHFYGLDDLISVAFFGLVMAYLYHFTRSLVPCILCHALYNVIVISWGWWIDRSPEQWWGLAQ